VVLLAPRTEPFIIISLPLEGFLFFCGPMQKVGRHDICSTSRHNIFVIIVLTDATVRFVLIIMSCCKPSLSYSNLDGVLFI
jgi:hypothetical protein